MHISQLQFTFLHRIKYRIVKWIYNNILFITTFHSNRGLMEKIKTPFWRPTTIVKISLYIGTSHSHLNHRILVPGTFPSLHLHWIYKAWKERWPTFKSHTTLSRFSCEYYWKAMIYLHKLKKNSRRHDP